LPRASSSTIAASAAASRTGSRTTRPRFTTTRATGVPSGNRRVVGSVWVGFQVTVSPNHRPRVQVEGAQVGWKVTVSRVQVEGAQVEGARHGRDVHRPSSTATVSWPRGLRCTEAGQARGTKGQPVHRGLPRTPPLAPRLAKLNSSSTSTEGKSARRPQALEHYDDDVRSQAQDRTSSRRPARTTFCTTSTHLRRGSSSRRTWSSLSRHALRFRPRLGALTGFEAAARSPPIAGASRGSGRGSPPPSSRGDSSTSSRSFHSSSQQRA
jgi:hypothetical protein